MVVAAKLCVSRRLIQAPVPRFSSATWSLHRGPRPHPSGPTGSSRVQVLEQLCALRCATEAPRRSRLGPLAGRLVRRRERAPRTAPTLVHQPNDTRPQADDGGRHHPATDEPVTFGKVDDAPNAEKHKRHGSQQIDHCCSTHETHPSSPNRSTRVKSPACREPTNPCASEPVVRPTTVLVEPTAALVRCRDPPTAARRLDPGRALPLGRIGSTAPGSRAVPLGRSSSTFVLCESARPSRAPRGALRRNASRGDRLQPSGLPSRRSRRNRWASTGTGRRPRRAGAAGRREPHWDAAVVETVVAVPAAPPASHLDQPRPDLARSGADRDGVRPLALRARKQLVALGAPVGLRHRGPGLPGRRSATAIASAISAVDPCLEA